MNEKSFWSIVARSSCCTQNSKTPISVVWEIQSSNFCCWKFAQRWAIEWWNNYTACTATNVILPFQQGNHFCSSFQSQNDYSVSPTWHQVLQVYLLFTAIHMVHVMTQNMESRKTMVSRRNCHWQSPLQPLHVWISKLEIKHPQMPQFVWSFLGWFLSWLLRKKCFNSFRAFSSDYGHHFKGL